MNDKFVGVLGSIGAALIGFAGLNFVSTNGGDWGFVLIAGPIWGLLSGLLTAWLGHKFPVIAGAIVSALFMGLVIALMSQIPGGIVTTAHSMIVMAVKVLGLGLFIGFGYKLAILSRVPTPEH